MSKSLSRISPSCRQHKGQRKAGWTLLGASVKAQAKSMGIIKSTPCWTDQEIEARSFIPSTVHKEYFQLIMSFKRDVGPFCIDQAKETPLIHRARISFCQALMPSATKDSAGIWGSFHVSTSKRRCMSLLTNAWFVLTESSGS